MKNLMTIKTLEELNRTISENENLIIDVNYTVKFDNNIEISSYRIKPKRLN